MAKRKGIDMKMNTWASRRSFVERVCVQNQPGIHGSIAKYVLWAIQSFGDDECWPSIQTIMDMTQLSRSTVKRAIKSLESADLIRVIRRKASDGDNITNLYSIVYNECLDTVAQGEPTPRSMVDQTLGSYGTAPRFPMDRRTCNTEPSYKIHTHEIEKIYNAYPRKVAKPAALKAIAAALRRLAGRGEPPEGHLGWGSWLLARTEAYRGSVPTLTSEQKFTPHPATWFNQDRFDDDIKPTAGFASRNDERRAARAAMEFPEV